MRCKVVPQRPHRTRHDNGHYYVQSTAWHRLRDWSRSVGSYGNNTLVICCPAPGRPKSAARVTSPPDNKSVEGVVAVTPDRLWSVPIITWLNNIGLNIFTTKYVQNHHQIERRRLLASIVTSRISLTTGVVALYIPSWRVGVSEEHHQARMWPVNAERVICRHQINLCGIINHHKHIREYFWGCISRRFKHNHDEPYRHWHQDSDWHALSIVTHAIARRREL